jgi:hypothetical protein
MLALRAARSFIKSRLLSIDRLAAFNLRAAEPETEASTLAGRSESVCCHSMVDLVQLSSVRNERCALHACCTQRGACDYWWEIDIDQTIQILGDLTLGQLRQELRCPRCHAPVTTTLVSTK